MGKIFILIITLLVSYQCNSNNTGNRKRSFIQKDAQKSVELIGLSLKTLQDKEKELNCKFEFLTLESYFFDINGDGMQEEIIIQKIKDWNDPGDFHRILIKSQEREVSFFNSDGWVKIGTYETQYLNSFSKTSQVNSSYINIQKSSDRDILLFAFGYAYASQPGLLSILNLSRFIRPVLIFNANYHLYSHEDKNIDGILDIVVTKYNKDETNNTNSLITYLLIDGGYQPK